MNDIDRLREQLHDADRRHGKQLDELRGQIAEYARTDKARGDRVAMLEQAVNALTAIAEGLRADLEAVAGHVGIELGLSGGGSEFDVIDTIGQAARESLDQEARRERRRG